jgi:dolichol-phosphate mannosyltransferase
MDLSIIIPSYNESQNITILLDELFKCFSENKIAGEAIVVDDDSPDMTWQHVEHYQKDTGHKVSIIRRVNKRGLSSAVVEGITHAQGKIIGVMDADLSHPPSKIPEMVGLIEKGYADFVIGSRYVTGGRVSNWPLRRKYISRIATYLAKPLVAISDPMAGFFFFEKEKIEGCSLNPRDFKIGLELMVKGPFTKIEEVPIAFRDRFRGESKLGSGVVLDYLVQLVSLFLYKYVIINQFVKFVLVGGSGVLVNLFVYSVMVSYMSLHYVLSATLSFIVANICNYYFNRVFTFNIRHGRRFFFVYLKFLTVCTLGYIINIVSLICLVEVLHLGKITAQLFAILLSTLNNFIGSKQWAFRNSDALVR